MTDITDQDRRQLRDDAKAVINKTAMRSSAAVSIAQYVLATVEAPVPSLAEELANITEDWGSWTSTALTAALNAATDHAKQTEQERDEALAELERLKREQDRLNAQVQGLVRRDGDHNSEVRMLTEERDEACAEVERLTAERDKARYERDEARDEANALDEELAGAESEVERLTAVNEELRRTDNFREFRDKFLTVQKAAESNAETPDPADVKPGEAWIVEVNGKRGTALKDGGGFAPWSVVIDGAYSSRCDEFVTLVSRLVPAPRTVRYEPKEK